MAETKEDSRKDYFQELEDRKEEKKSERSIFEPLKCSNILHKSLRVRLDILSVLYPFALLDE